MQHNRKLGSGMERLESRAMCAGDVTAAVINGDLILEGDDSGNDFLVIGSPTPGKFIIRGATSQNCASSLWHCPATTINGQSEITVIGVHDDMFVNLGNDLVIDDQIGFVNVEVADDLILVSEGDSNILMHNINVGDDAQFELGAEETRSTMFMRGGSVQDNFQLAIQGVYWDTVVIESASFGGNVDIEFGPGYADLGLIANDVGGSASIDMGAGDDSVFARFNTGRIDVDGGDGVDEINITTNAVEQSFEDYDQVKGAVLFYVMDVNDGSFVAGGGVTGLGGGGSVGSAGRARAHVREQGPILKAKAYEPGVIAVATAASIFDWGWDSFTQSTYNGP